MSSSSRHDSVHARHRERSRERSSERDRTSSSSRAHSDRDREKDKKKRSRSRDRSRSRSRDRDRERKRDKSDASSSRRRRSRSRSRSRSASRGKKEKKEKKKEKESSRDLERALKKAQKLLKHGGTDADAAGALDPALLDKLIAEQKAKADAKAKAKQSKRSKRSSKDKRRHSDSSDSDASASSSDSDEEEEDDRAGQSLLLSDGVTPRLFKSDYFARSTEFRVWLHEAYGKHVDDIPSKTARKRFAEFVEQWNKGALHAKFYKGMDASTLSAASLTKHKWGFANKMSEAEKMALASMRDEIDTSTCHRTFNQEFKGQAANPDELKRVSASALAMAAEREAAAAAGGVPAAAAAASSSSRGRESTEEREDRIRRERAEQKRLNSHHSMVMEELVPRPTGHEAMLQKRAAKGSYARPDQDAGGIDAGVSERDLMGSSGSSEYQAMLAKRQNQQASKDNERAAKLSEHQLKEKEKMKALLSSLGLQDKYPMQ